MVRAAMPMSMMRMAVLGSGSGGNATLVQSKETTLLIDAGLSAKQIKLRMEELDVSVGDLDAVLLTHEHSDHTKGTRVLLKGLETPVYANALTKECLQHKMDGVKWKVFQNNSPFEINEIEVKAFPVPHDAQEPVGYVLHNTEVKLGVLTDVGYITNVIRESLRGADALFLEANYDQELLDSDMKRPWSIKQRIASRHGHLSNEQAAELLGEIACEKLKHVIVGHLSSDCNTEKHVREAIQLKCDAAVHPFLSSLHCASQDRSTGWVHFGVDEGMLFPVW